MTTAILQRNLIDDGEPLFSTVRSALSFAYSITEYPIAAVCMFGVPEGSSGRLRGLSAHEKHAQGALIRRAVEQRLTGMELSVTFAFYGFGAVRSMAIREVTRHIAPLIKKSGLGRELVLRYFNSADRRRMQQSIAVEFFLSQQTISRLALTVGRAIDELRISTEERLEAMFVSTGIAAGL